MTCALDHGHELEFEAGESFAQAVVLYEVTLDTATASRPAPRFFTCGLELH